MQTSEKLSSGKVVSSIRRLRRCTDVTSVMVAGYRAIPWSQGSPTALLDVRRVDINYMETRGLHIVRGEASAKRVLGYTPATSLDRWDTGYPPNEHFMSLLTSSPTSFSVVVLHQRIWDIVPSKRSYKQGARGVETFAAVLTFSFQREYNRHSFECAVRDVANDDYDCASVRVRQVLGNVHDYKGEMVRADIVLYRSRDADLKSSRFPAQELDVLGQVYNALRDFASTNPDRLGCTDFALHHKSNEPSYASSMGEILIRTRLLLNALPSPETKPVEPLLTKWESYNKEPPTALQEVLDLYHETTQLVEVHTLWLAVRAARRSEPAYRAECGSELGQNMSWEFGADSSDSTRNFKIERVAINVTVLPRCVAGTSTRKVNFAFEQGVRIVGWSVYSLNGSRHNWWKDKDGLIITTHSGTIAFQRGILLHSRWRVTVFIVRDLEHLSSFLELERRAVYEI